MAGGRIADLPTPGKGELWQLAYAELFVTPVLWPDFGRQQLYEAILEYQRRDRRFGKVSV